jgi:hypothetical protein
MSPRRLTSARLAGALLAVTTLLALAAIALVPGGRAVSVPNCADAGGLRMKPCHYPIQQGDYTAHRGTLVTPEDRAAPASRLVVRAVRPTRAAAEPRPLALRL